MIGSARGPVGNDYTLKRSHMENLSKSTQPTRHYGAIIMSEESSQKPTDNPETPPPEKTAEKPKEIGGPKGPEPTRYGDWEKAGRCIDF